jgi:hypothetical protein
MAGVAQRKQVPGLAVSFVDPQNKISSASSASTKTAYAAGLAYKFIVVHFD